MHLPSDRCGVIANISFFIELKRKKALDYHFTAARVPHCQVMGWQIRG
jgi:hypothetical protein